MRKQATEEERGARKPSGTYLLMQNKQRQPVTEQKGHRPKGKQEGTFKPLI